MQTSCTSTGSSPEYDTLLLVDLVHVQASVAQIICLFTAVAVFSEARKPVVKNRLGSDQ